MTTFKRAAADDGDRVGQGDRGHVALAVEGPAPDTGDGICDSVVGDGRRNDHVTLIVATLVYLDLIVGGVENFVGNHDSVAVGDSKIFSPHGRQGCER